MLPLKEACVLLLLLFLSDASSSALGRDWNTRRQECGCDRRTQERAAACLRLRGGSYLSGQDTKPVIIRKPRPVESSQSKPKQGDAAKESPTEVSHEIKTAIMKARQAKKMTQKDLAQALNESVQTIQWYENGKAVPNNALIAKMERVLGTKLPRVKKVKQSAATADDEKQHSVTSGGAS